jgi:hypothetical protein
VLAPTVDGVVVDALVDLVDLVDVFVNRHPPPVGRRRIVANVPTAVAG